MTVAAALVVAPPILSTPPAAATAATAAQPDTGSQRLTLPRPTGPYAVGREILHLVDHTRPDPWMPEARARELMVRHPDHRAHQGPPRPRPDPLVVLSPGFGVHRHTLTHLAEELASRGYAVAAVDHAYESVGTAFPGGRVLTCAACEAVDGKGQEAIAHVAEGRAPEVAFLLDQLTGDRPAWRHAELIDHTRIGMAGHSIGGNSAATTMAADPRVLAGVNMDGTFSADVPADGLNGRPFLMLSSEEVCHSSTAFEDWELNWQRLDGPTPGNPEVVFYEPSQGACGLAAHVLGPSTLAYGLTDSPAGMFAWVLERWVIGATTAATSRPCSARTTCSPTP